MLDSGRGLGRSPAVVQPGRAESITVIVFSFFRAASENRNSNSDELYSKVKKTYTQQKYDKAKFMAVLASIIIGVRR